MDYYEFDVSFSIQLKELAHRVCPQLRVTGPPSGPKQINFCKIIYDKLFFNFSNLSIEYSSRVLLAVGACQIVFGYGLKSTNTMMCRPCKVEIVLCAPFNEPIKPIF
uniref:Uncharacterized protein n=1 Tax=Lygus hesperus TaxID=30085 RepID=A0A146MCT9_LYGHE